MLRQKLLVIMSAKGACYHVCYILTKSHQSYMLQDVSINAGCACTGLAVPHHNLGIQVVHGPLSIAIGLGAGVVLGFVCALTPVWSSPLRRAVALLTFGELLAFCGYVLFSSRLRSLARSLAHSLTHSLVYSVTWSFPAAGYVATLAMAGLSSLVWRRSSLSQLCNRLAPGQSTHLTPAQ